MIKPLLISSCLLLMAACGGGGGTSGNFDGTGSGGTGGTGGTTTPPNPATNRIGTGSGATFQQGVINASETDVDSGETITLRVNVETQNGQIPAADSVITFSSPCISGGLATLGATVTKVTPGLYSTTYTNNGCNGDDLVTARLGDNGTTATVKLTVHGPQALSVIFDAPPEDLTLSLAGIGGKETMELTFSVTGVQGAPIVGKQVSFSINTQVGGASILPGRETGLTDQNGKVRTVIKSGTIAGPVNVLAVHNESGRQGLSGDIVISTGIPEASRFSMAYTPQNPAHAFDTDGVPVNITIIASDTFGNNVPTGTRISFVAPESGNIGSSCSIVVELGTCGVTWRSTSPRPADGRVSVIAYTDGAEDFQDRNGNSVYDQGDGGFVDLSEPFADEEENGQYDLGDFFFDTNKNGVWDVGNGQWDGPCLKTVSPTAICNGNKTVVIWKTIPIVMSRDRAEIFDSGTFPAVDNPIVIQQGTSITLTGLHLSDDNGLVANPLPFDTTVTFSIEGSGVTIQGLPTDKVPNTTDPTLVSYGVTLTAAATVPTTQPQLVLTVTPPAKSPTRFMWPITITP